MAGKDKESGQLKIDFSSQRHTRSKEALGTTEKDQEFVDAVDGTPEITIRMASSTEF